MDKENEIVKLPKKVEIYKNNLKNKFQKIVQNLNLEVKEKLKKIEPALSLTTMENVGRILVDDISGKVYYSGYNNNNFIYKYIGYICCIT